MLRSLLIPLDGSPLSETSLPIATEVARASGARMHLAHVHIPYEPDQLLSNSSFHWEGVDLSEYDARHRRDEKEYLSGLEERLGADGTVVDSRILDGPAVADDLARYAADVRADMVFLTSRGRSGVRRAWLGSVADELIQRMQVPMLVNHPEAETSAPQVFDIRHILIPLDGSTRSESVLGAASELAEVTGARLTLLRVVWAPDALGQRMVSPRPREGEPEVDAARSYLEEVADRLRGTGLDVSVHVVHNRSPAMAIETIAEFLDADLIAMATHGYGGFKRAVLGSVSDRLVRSSRRPVLVIRPSPEA